MAGEWLEVARGGGGAGGPSVLDEEQVSPMGQLGTLLVINLFFALDGPGVFLRALLASLERFPLAEFPVGKETQAAGALAVALLSQSFRVGVSLAGPVLVATLLLDALLGAMNRLAPNLPVHFLGMPVKALGVSILALLTLDAVLDAVRGWLMG
jgi:flagellar biosynthetic protein FliR